ncbi:hypothetical protein [Amycolatopsis sp. NPDC051061]
MPWTRTIGGPAPSVSKPMTVPSGDLTELVMTSTSTTSQAL